MAAVYIRRSHEDHPRLYRRCAPGGAARSRRSAASRRHYLTGVLRLAARRSGPGLQRPRRGVAGLSRGGRRSKAVTLRCERHVADVRLPPDIDYVFAPLKHARLDYVVQKATELGARRLVPVITQRTIAERVNLERMRANVVEAAEQCNLVFVPEVLEPREAAAACCRDWEPGRRLVYCDETAATAESAGRAEGPGGARRRPHRARRRLHRRGKGAAAGPCPSSRRFRLARASCGPIRRRLRP